MRAKTIVVLAATAGLLAAVSATLAQRPDRPRPFQGPRPPNRADGQGPAKGELPADEKLMGLYLNFVRDAEKLAKDYETAGKTELARGVYLEILKFAPNYKPAKDKLEQFREKEETADKKSVDIHANQGWQETGITTVPGKVLTITATGTWTCKINQEVGPEGLQVSEQLRDCNVGSLVGVVVPPTEKDASGRTKDIVLQPFSVGAAKQFTPSIAGKLMFRIYDIKTADNTGKLKVEVMGTFERK